VLVVTVRGMPYPSDLNDDQWALLAPVFNAPGKRGRKHGDDLRTVVDAMLYIAQTGCQWRYLPESFGAWIRVWSQFRRWSRNGTWARAVTVLPATARQADGRTEGVSAVAARTLGQHHDLEVRRVGWDDKQPVFRPIRHAWRVEVAHGRLGRSRRFAKSFENTTISATGWLHVACIATTLRHLSQERPRQCRGPVAA
jgi:transposase